MSGVRAAARVGRQRPAPAAERAWSADPYADALHARDIGKLRRTKIGFARCAQQI